MQIGIGLGIPATHGNIAGFTPLELSPTLWLDASDTSTITEVSGAVSQWDDKSGNGNHIAQGTAANQPTSGTRTINGLNVIDFDGSSDWMRTAVADNVTQPNTILVVAQTDTTNALRYLFDSTFSANRHVFQSTATATWSMFAGASLGGGTADTNEHLFRMVFNGASSSLHVDGSSTVTGNAGALSFDIATIGVANSTTAGFWDGTIAELILIDRLATASEIAATERYLADKWGITI